MSCAFAKAVLPIDGSYANFERISAVSRVFRIGRRAIFSFVGLVAITVLLFICSGALLAVPSEQPRRVDVVVVLGGSADSMRYERGRDLVLADYSDRLVLIGATAAQLQDTRKAVPGAVSWQDALMRNSWGEAEATRAWMKAAGLRSVIVVSDPPHMLRLKYTWGSIFRGADLDYVLVATDPPWWPGWMWWRNKSAANFVGTEVKKLCYYVVKYRFDF